MSLRLEFVSLAQNPDVNVADLCRRFGISRQTAYKWLERFRSGGVEALADRSRRPHSMPRRTKAEVRSELIALRQAHPAWGPRKLRRRLEDLGMSGLPAPSTIATLLQREGFIEPNASDQHRAHVRFERSRPNELWQMDFKGHFALSRGGRCHPLTVLDDHARYLIGLRACARENDATVRPHLRELFHRYGLPENLLCDNGPPWSGCGGEWTALALWLVRLGIRVLHGRPHHPQTQGKEERFHRTLKAEVLTRSDLHDLDHSQQIFDRWRLVYNHQRPHAALRAGHPLEPLCAQLPRNARYLATH